MAESIVIDGAKRTPIGSRQGKFNSVTASQLGAVAIKAAIDQVGLLLLEDHIKGCVVSAVKQGDRSKVDELVRAVERFARA